MKPFTYTLGLLLRPLGGLLFIVAPLLLSGGCSNQPLLVNAGHPESLYRGGARMTDSAIRADLYTIKSLRDRVRQLHLQGYSADNYYLCKATAWLDMAYDEYTDNDRTGITRAALEQAMFIIKQMEQPHSAAMARTTPIIKASALVRKDLWQLVAGLQAQDSELCLSCDLAKLEVQLVWVGHEYQEMGWRHAYPAVQAAERHARNALASQQQCPALQLEELKLLPRKVYFALDDALLDDTARRLLNDITTILHNNAELDLMLVGHTDYRGDNAYNLRLSQQRSKNVAEALIANGINHNRLRLSAMGGLQPQTAGNSQVDLASNRRVEILFINRATPTSQPIDDQHISSELRYDQDQRACYIEPRLDHSHHH